MVTFLTWRAFLSPADRGSPLQRLLFLWIRAADQTYCRWFSTYRLAYPSPSDSILTDCSAALLLESQEVISARVAVWLRYGTCNTYTWHPLHAHYCATQCVFAGRVFMSVCKPSAASWPWGIHWPVSLQQHPAVEVRSVSVGPMKVSPLFQRCTHSFPQTAHRSHPLIPGICSLNTDRNIFIAVNRRSFISYWPFLTNGLLIKTRCQGPKCKK